MRLSLWIAGRYLRTRRQSGFISLLTGISIGGVTVGVTALLTVLAVMNGFESEVQTRIAGTDAHVVLLGENTAAVKDADPLAASVAKLPGVAGVAPFVYTKAIVFHEGLTEGLVVKGVDLRAERTVTTIGKHIEPPLDSIPRMTPGGAPGIVLGSELAARLGTGPGQRVTLVSMVGARNSAMGFAPKLRAFQVVGIFTSGLYTYDSSFGFTSLPAAQDFFGYQDGVTGLEIRLDDMFDAPRMAARILAALHRPDLRSNNWIELNRNLFTWMKLEKVVMFVILALIVVVATFNIVSTLFMVVLEKRRDIGVLKSLGASDGLVLRVFLWKGLLIGAAGTFLGATLGVTLIEILRRYPFVKLPGDVYFIERLPVRPEWGDFAAVILAALSLCLIAALYPAWRASRLDPVEAIRGPV
ncbi:MAG TPA: FtsX-like permease family protein [Candidatus Sulfotelmatobacter sp.]|nr:FtsX-like permease family protein [Candidatus Sulfotelmatobacter sp.]